MATTSVRVQSPPGVSTTRLFLVALGGTGTPAAGGYLNQSDLAGWYNFNTVTEALVGSFFWYTANSATQTLANGVLILRDDTATYFGFDPPSSNHVNWTLASAIADAQTALTNQNYTTGRGTNLDNLNATVSSRSTLTAANVWDYLTSAATTAGSLGKLIVDNLNATITSRSTLTAAAIWDYLTSAATTAGSLGKLIVDNLNATITSRLSDADNVTRQAVLVAEHDATQAQITALNNLSIANVQTAMTDQGYTSARSNNLDATISSREAESAAATRGTTNVTEHDATQATLAAFNNLSIANVQTAMTNQNYTSARGTNLDNLDATVSSRSTLTAANVWDYLTSTATTVGSLGKLIVDNLNATITSRSTLTAAAIWDYLTSTATTVGSLGKLIVDNLNATITSRESESSAATRETTNQTEHDATQTNIAAITVTITGANITSIAAGVWDALESTVVTTSSMGLKVKNNLNATITSRLSDADNVTRQAVLVAEHDATQAQITALNNLSIANVQTAMTDQGYTTGRGPNLDNLNATVSSRAVDATMVTRFNTLDTGVTNIRSDIAAINVAAGCSSALVSAGYTSARSTKLDNLDFLTVAAPTTAAITNAVLDKALSSHVTAGTVGAGLTLARDQSTVAANNTQD